MKEIRKQLHDLDIKSKNIIFTNDDNSTISKNNLLELKKVFTNNSIRQISNNIYSKKYHNNINYNEICFIHESLKDFYEKIESIKYKIDIENFLDSGEIIDIKILTKTIKERGKWNDFKHIDFKRLKQLFKNPPTKLKPMDNSSDEYIIYDRDIVSKFLMGIVQLMTDEMDLVFIYSGSEGSGKSCACSQDMSLCYYLMKEIKLIDYDYNIKEMWTNTVTGFNEIEDKYFNSKFRIIGLDEGNELNSQEWQNPAVKTFFQRLRRERFQQRLKFIAIPQLVELLKGLAVSRMNYFFYMSTKSDIRTKGLIKGFCDFYIVPRDKEIYSFMSLRNLKDFYVKNTLTNYLKDKNTGYSRPPTNIIIKKFKRNHIWGFDRNDYIANLKDTNKTYSVEKGLRFSEYETYLLYKFMPLLKDWGFTGHRKKKYKQAYGTLNKIRSRINKIFTENPDKKEKFDRMLKEHVEKNLRDIDNEDLFKDIDDLVKDL